MLLILLKQSTKHKVLSSFFFLANSAVLGVLAVSPFPMTNGKWFFQKHFRVGHILNN